MKEILELLKQYNKKGKYEAQCFIRIFSDGSGYVGTSYITPEFDFNSVEELIEGLKKKP